MSNRGERQRRGVELSFGKRKERAHPVTVARIRLHRWGNAIRAIVYAQGPSATPYSQQPFVRQRVDHEAIFRMAQRADTFAQAAQTDRWLEPIKGSDAYRAVAIRFVDREQGKPLGYEEQIRRFHTVTGKGKTTYYRELNKVYLLLAHLIETYDTPS